jgi:hypothetical protein
MFLQDEGQQLQQIEGVLAGWLGRVYNSSDLIWPARQTIFNVKQTHH